MMAKKYFENSEDIGIIESMMYDHIYDNDAEMYIRNGLSEEVIVLAAILLTGIITAIILSITVSL